MAKPKLKKITVVTEGRFEEIVPPSFDLFDITLKERDYQIKNEKTDELISSDKTFEIVINASKIIQSFIPSLSDELKVAFSLNFAPYQYSTKSYNFYVNHYSEASKRKDILTGIFDTLEEFEKDYKEKISNTGSIFEKAKDEIKDFSTEEFDIKYLHDLDTFVVVAKSYIGSDSYKRLASCSLKLGRVGENIQVQELFKNEKYNKKSFFIINKDDFAGINDYIRSLKANKETFIENQTKLFNSDTERYESLKYNEDNIFNYKLGIDEERKCFIFFCNGYEVSSWEGRPNARNLLQSWALNQILSSPVDEMKGDHVNDYEVVKPNYAKESLIYQKDSSIKEKEYFIPFEQIEKIERIHKNFQKEIDLWSRPQHRIKKKCDLFTHTTQNGSVNLKKYPAIFLEADGQAYFTFDYKDVRSSKVQSNVIAMKGFKITPQEFEYFTTQHPLAEQIIENTKHLNVQIWAGYSATTNEQEKQQAYEDVSMAYRLHNINNDKKVVTRKKKI